MRATTNTEERAMADRKLLMIGTAAAVAVLEER